MKNKEQDRASQAPGEANRDKHINFHADEDPDTGADTSNDESTETRRRKHDADSGNDGSTNAILQQESRIDPGNEHHHTRTDADDTIFDDDIDRSPRYDADAGGDGSGTVGKDPAER